MTYRSNIKKVIPTTYFNTDSGWGCMLRVAQMAIANYLFIYRHKKPQQIVPLFWDNSDIAFSIQCIVRSASEQFPHKKPYQWFNPCEAAFIIKDLIQKYIFDVSVTVCLDNSFFLSQINTNKANILVMLLIRIGLNEPEQIYLKSLSDLMMNKYYFAALGGTPKHAHLFLKIKQGKIGYLDPHKTYKSIENIYDLNDKIQEYMSDLKWIKIQNIDSSMGLIFNFKKQQLNDFWESIYKIKVKNNQHFFIYMDTERPVYDQGDIIEIIQ